MKGFRAVSLPAMLLAVVCPGTVLRAGDSNPTNAPFPAVVTVPLEYQETNYNFISGSVAITPQSAPFKKEPATAAGEVVRGVLNFGGESSNAVPFLWQRGAGKLYLDLNRNGDLTDDPAGAFSAREAEGYAQRFSQTFTNVHLLFNTAAGQCPVLADINLWDYGTRPECSLLVRSFWQGKVTLQDRDWQVGVIPNFSPISFETGRLLLRPWAERGKAFYGYGGSLSIIPFSRKLFVDGHAYQLTCQTGSLNGEVKPALQFVEQSVAVGELKITGKFIQRLVLPGEPYLVVLDQPAGAVRVPVGSYNQLNLQLAQGSAVAYHVASPLPPAKRITVTDRAPTLLAIGGPLTNTVFAARQGRYLRLNYQLIGAGGETYELDLLDRDYLPPPQFTVYKGERKIASGKFEFG
jgi:hypothetical protein